MPPPSGSAQKCRPGAIADEQHLLSDWPKPVRPVQSASKWQRRVVICSGGPWLKLKSQVPLHDELPPLNIGAPASGSRPPVKAIVPQQNCDDVQSSGPSQVRTAPPVQEPPDGTHDEEVAPVLLFTVTQQS